jgi:hypothetical protein
MLRGLAGAHDVAPKSTAYQTIDLRCVLSLTSEVTEARHGVRRPPGVHETAVWVVASQGDQLGHSAHKEGDYTRKKVTRVMTSSSTSTRRQAVRLGQLSSGVEARCMLDVFASESGHASRLVREGCLSDDIRDARGDDDLRCLERLQVFGYSGKSRA